MLCHIKRMPYHVYEYVLLASLPRRCRWSQRLRAVQGGQHRRGRGRLRVRGVHAGALPGRARLLRRLQRRQVRGTGRSKSRCLSGKQLQARRSGAMLGMIQPPDTNEETLPLAAGRWPRPLLPISIRV